MTDRRRGQDNKQRGACVRVCVFVVLFRVISFVRFTGAGRTVRQTDRENVESRAVH